LTGFLNYVHSTNESKNELIKLALGYKTRDEKAEAMLNQIVANNDTIFQQANAVRERAELAEKTVAELEKKIVNLHAIIDKQGVRVSRQAARITELEALYAGTKRAKKAANIKAKYKALKAYCGDRL